MKIVKSLFQIAAICTLSMTFIPLGMNGQRVVNEDDETSWNIGLGFGAMGNYTIDNDGPNSYFNRTHVRSYFGYSISKNHELGVVFDARFQRTNIDYENNENGLGGGYYYRYSFTKFDPFKAIFKNLQFSSILFLEWEHLLADHYYLEESLDRERLNMVNSNTFDNHHFLPKVGVRSNVYNGFFVNFQVFYHMVNGAPVDFPLRYRLGFEYAF